MKDFFRNNGPLILVIAVLLAAITAVTAYVFQGAPSPLGNVLGVVTTPIRNGLSSLAGWAEGNAARGINLLLGKVDADVVDLDGAALRVVGAETSVRPVFEDGQLTGLNILCRVEANVAEEPPHSDMDDAEDRGRLVRMLAGVEQARIENALSLAGELDADFLDLEDMACLAAPWSAQAVRAQWDVSALEFQVEVQARVLRGYDADE